MTEGTETKVAEGSMDITSPVMNDVTWSLSNGNPLLELKADGEIRVLGEPARSDRQILRALMISIAFSHPGQTRTLGDELLGTLREPEPCARCKGRGFVVSFHFFGFQGKTGTKVLAVCPDCEGNGQMGKENQRGAVAPEAEDPMQASIAEQIEGGR